MLTWKDPNAKSELVNLFDLADNSTIVIGVRIALAAKHKANVEPIVLRLPQLLVVTR